jgi:hypothetical protein
VPPVPDEITRLVQALVEGDDQARSAAADQLIAMGPDAAPAIPMLIQALGNQDAQARQAVAQVLASLGPQAELALPALMQALADPNVDVQQIVAGALGAFGPQAMQAVPELIQALQGANPQLQATIVEALRAITGEDLGMEPALWQAWWDSLQAGSEGPLDFLVPSMLDDWQKLNGNYEVTIILHITGGAGPFIVHHDTDAVLTADRQHPLVFLASGCTIVHTIKVESSDGQSVLHDYYINSPWCS